MITIIILLILAGITINFMLGDNGILNRAKNAGETYEQQAAREKLEIALADLGADKIVDSTYNENAYIDDKLAKQDMIVNGDIVTVDGWQFEIDRRVPQIKQIKNNKIDLGYVNRGLYICYDGIYNNGKNHNNKATVWTDLSGNNLNGELKYFSDTLESEWLDKSLAFDGVNDGVYIGNALENVFKNSNTIEMVLEFSQLNQRDILIGNFDTKNSINYEREEIGNRLAIWFNDEWRVHPYVNTTGAYVPETNQKVTLTFVYDKENSIIKMYKDGQYSTESIQAVYGEYRYDYRNVWIGRDTREGETSLKGKIYSVRVYKDMLTEEEILKNFNNDVKRF